MSVSRNPADFRAVDSSLFMADPQPSSEAGLAERTVWTGDVDSVPLGVSVSEVEEAFSSAIAVQMMAAEQDGQHEGIYLKLGQTQAGRLLAILFAYRGTRNAWILSARAMAPQERRYYHQRIDAQFYIASK
jgi:uncharacterized DUF497 family protein